MVNKVSVARWSPAGFQFCFILICGDGDPAPGQWQWATAPKANSQVGGGEDGFHVRGGFFLVI